MKKAVLFCSLLLVGTTGTVLPSMAAPHTPKAGSGERKALMNALRPKLGSGKHKPIITPYHLKVENGWAFVEGGFNYEGGAPLEEQFTEGSGTNFSALLHRESSKWRVKKFLYHGDVVAPEFMQAFPSAPRAIFQ